MNSKLVSTDDAASLIKDNDTIAFNPRAEEILIGIEKRFLEKGSPRNLTIFGSVLISDFASRGGHHLVHKGLLKRVISGHVGVVPRIGQLIMENKIEGYIFPMGEMVRLSREAARGRDGIFTKIGLGTFADPEYGGGKQNKLTEEKGEDLVEKVNLNGEPNLYYKCIPLDVCIIKGSVADEIGNISYEGEIFASGLSELYTAMATRRNGGKVIAQVRWIAKERTIPASSIVVPHNLVDAIIVEDPENQITTTVRQFGLSYLQKYSSSLSGDLRVPLSEMKPAPLDVNKVVARRAAFELRPGQNVNFGFGIPGYIMYLAKIDEGMGDDFFTQTVEFGMVGGTVLLVGIVPFIGDIPFGPILNPDAIFDISTMFDFIEGGGINQAFLSFSQMDKEGNINVSRFSSFLVGPGGFVEISQSTKKLVFCGTFTAGLADIEIKDGELNIKRDGQKKILNEVEQITFNGKEARARGEQEIMAVTERAVFEYKKEGLVLTEIAPGIDLEKDILDKMEFKPIVADNLKEMDSKIFKPEPMGIKGEILKISKGGE